MSLHEGFLREAIRLATEARKKGNHPFGAVLVLDGRVVFRAGNSVIVDSDPTRHAEMNLIRRAVSRLPKADLRRATIYCSCEPCAMCAGAVFWAGIRRVVYSLPAEDLAGFTDGRFVVPCRSLFSLATDPVDVVGPLLIEEGCAVHQGAWTKGAAPG